VPNRWCEPYSPEQNYVLEGLVYDKRYGFGDHTFSGPDVGDISNGMASAPVTWQYHSETIDLRFNVGFLGASQDQMTLKISPLVGWYITLYQDHEDETKSFDERLELFLRSTEDEDGDKPRMERIMLFLRRNNM